MNITHVYNERPSMISGNIFNFFIYWKDKATIWSSVNSNYLKLKGSTDKF